MKKKAAVVFVSFYEAAHRLLRLKILPLNEIEGASEAEMIKKAVSCQFFFLFIFIYIYS